MSGLRAQFAVRSDPLVLPTANKDQVDQYVAKQSVARGDVGRVPFPRLMDFWTFSLGVALALDMPPKEGAVSTWGTKFIYAYQSPLDEDTCGLLAVVATARMGHESPDVDDPGKIIELANRLAGAGCPYVLRKLSEDALRTDPLDRVISLARSLLDQVRAGS